MAKREDKLQAKAAEIQEELQQWLKKEFLLWPGEQICFTMEIVKHPTVINHLVVPRTRPDTRIRVRVIDDPLIEQDWITIFQLAWSERDQNTLEAIRVHGVIHNVDPSSYQTINLKFQVARYPYRLRAKQRTSAARRIGFRDLPIYITKVESPAS